VPNYTREWPFDDVLDKRPVAGLIASFALGASTQLDITKKIRRALLNGASRDVWFFLSTQVMLNMAQKSRKRRDERIPLSISPSAMPLLKIQQYLSKKNTDQQSVKKLSRGY